MDDNGNNGFGDRVEGLKKAAIASENLKRKRREWKDFERLKSVVGGALLANAAEHPDFDLLLKDVLRSAAIVESDKKLLRSKGLL